MAEEKKSALKKILMIAGIVLLADVVGGFLILKYAVPMFYKTETAGGQTEKTEKKKDAKDLEPTKVAPLEAIALNPLNSNGELLSTEIVLESREDAVVEELKMKDAQIRDVIISYLSSKTVGDLNDITKREQLKKDMILKINAVLRSGKVTALYTKSWIIQFE